MAALGTHRSRVPWVIAAAAVPMLVFELVLTGRNNDLHDLSVYVALLMIPGYLTVGGLVASRDPSNRLGWLMMVMGIGFLLTGLADEYTQNAFVTDPGTLPFGFLAAWLNNVVLLLVLGPIPVFLATFPTGRPHSSRWRFLPVATTVAAAISFVATAFAPGKMEGALQIENPAGVAGLRVPLAIAAGVGFIGLVVFAVLAVAALVLRYLRSSGEERQQLRWFAYTSSAALIAVVGTVITADMAPALNGLLILTSFVLLAVGLPVTVGIAILRYRLYDLDLVIKKAAVFAVLVAALFGAGAVAVVIVSSPVVERLYGLPAYMLLFGVVIGLLLLPLYRVSRRIADRLVYGGRLNPYDVLARFSGKVGEAYATEDVLPRTAAIVQQAVGASVARVWVLVGGELRALAASPEDAPARDALVVIADSLPAFPGEDGFEVRHRGDLLGALSVEMPANDPMGPSKERLIRDVATQAGLVLRNVLLVEDLRDSRRRIVAAQDERARKLERDIHDGAQQQLVALAVQLRLVRTMVERDPARTIEMLEDLEGAAGEALDDLRDLARGIYPPLLADKGLAAAVQAQARKAAMPVDVRATGIGRYEEDVEATVYFCTLEALNNAAKYAAATSVTVSLEQTDGLLIFSVTDDGSGFDRASVPRGSGLQGMTDRVEAVGGDLRITSRPGAGTTVSGTVPVRS
ncbi:MAG: sensor histidine kinase [Actinomycetota bacterium]